MPREAEIALAAYRSIPVDIGYITMPITSGPRCYDLAEERGCVSTGEFREKHPEDFKRFVMLPNLQEGNAFGKRVQEFSNIPIVIPGMLEANNPEAGFGWDDQEFMHLWRNLIREKIARLHLWEGWQYSNGSNEEFQIIMEKQRELGAKHIKVLDHQYRDMSYGRGCRMIDRAIEDVQTRGLDATRLDQRYREILRLQRK